MQKTLTLNTGYEIPLIGYGTYKLLDPEQCAECIVNATEVGYRLLDTAPQYFNEAMVGEGLKNVKVPREELFITSKIWFDMFEGDDPYRSVESSLKKLGVDYLDLVLIHWPFGNYYNAWRALEKMQEQGIVRSIGVSNFTPGQLVDIIQYNKVVPAVNQVETTILTQQHEWHEWMEKFGVTHQAFAPFGQGRNDEMFNIPELVQIAEAHGKTTRQVILRHITQRGIPTVPKTTSVERMKQNLDALSFELTAEEMDILNGLDQNRPLMNHPQDPKVGQASVKWGR